MRRHTRTFQPSVEVNEVGMKNVDKNQSKTDYVRCTVRQHLTHPKRRFSKDEQKMTSGFSIRLSKVRSPNRVRTPLQSASKLWMSSFVQKSSFGMCKLHKMNVHGRFVSFWKRPLGGLWFKHPNHCLLFLSMFLSTFFMRLFYRGLKVRLLYLATRSMSRSDSVSRIHRMMIE
jgi:hypothetical protein